LAWVGIAEVGAALLGFRGLPRFLGLTRFLGGLPRLFTGWVITVKARSLILSLISAGKAPILFFRFSAEVSTSDITPEAFLLGIPHLPYSKHDMIDEVLLSRFLELLKGHLNLEDFLKGLRSCVNASCSKADIKVIQTSVIEEGLCEASVTAINQLMAASL